MRLIDTHDATEVELACRRAAHFGNDDVVALGFTLAGTIPDYALKPHGGLTATKIYWKRIGRGT